MHEGNRKNSDGKIIAIIAAVAAVLIASFAVFLELSSNKEMAQIEPLDLSFLSELELPDSKIIAVGTPTHGNAEPIKLTLEILKKVHEEHGSVAFILEEVAGDAEIINKQHSYTKEDGSKVGMYLVYDNDEMSDILAWLKQTRQRFYGIDIQSISETTRILSEKLEALNFPEAKNILNLSVSSKELIEQNSPLLDMIEKFVDGQMSAGKISEQESAYLLHLSDCIKMNYEYILSDRSFEVRDEMMAKNVEWIMDYEKSYFNNDHAVLFASNGHAIKSNWSYAFSKDVYIPMGSILSKEYNEDYFLILTDAQENYFEAGTDMKNAANKKVFHIYNDYPEFDAGDENNFLIMCGGGDADENQNCKLVIIGSVFTSFRALRDTYYTAQVSPKESCNMILYFKLMTPTSADFT